MCDSSACDPSINLKCNPSWFMYLNGMQDAKGARCKVQGAKVHTVFFWGLLCCYNTFIGLFMLVCLFFSFCNFSFFKVQIKMQKCKNVQVTVFFLVRKGIWYICNIWNTIIFLKIIYVIRRYTKYKYYTAHGIKYM